MLLEEEINILNCHCINIEFFVINVNNWLSYIKYMLLILKKDNDFILDISNNDFFDMKCCLLVFLMYVNNY